MAMHVTDSMFERVARAGEHLKDLQARLEIVRGYYANSITTHFDPNPPHFLLIGQYVGSVPVGMSVPIRIGEICYNLRTALDYLVFELAKLDSGIEQPRTQFPIESTPEGFVARKDTFLKGLNAAHVAMIERLQPYAGCQWTKALADISNKDKHRKFIEMGGSGTIHVYTQIQDPAVFDGIDAPVRRTPHPTKGYVDVKVHVASPILFADGMPISETLEEIMREVANTLIAFKPEFKPLGVGG